VDQRCSPLIAAWKIERARTGSSKESKLQKVRLIFQEAKQWRLQSNTGHRALKQFGRTRRLSLLIVHLEKDGKNGTGSMVQSPAGTSNIADHEHSLPTSAGVPNSSWAVCLKI